MDNHTSIISNSNSNAEDDTIYKNLTLKQSGKLHQPSPQVVTDIGIFTNRRSGPAPTSVKATVRVRSEGQSSETAVTSAASASEASGSANSASSEPMTEDDPVEFCCGDVEQKNEGGGIGELLESATALQETAQDEVFDDMEENFTLIHIKAHSDPVDMSKRIGDASPQQNVSIRKACSFTNIDIHEHEVILGDNPCAYGPSLSLGWKRVGTLSLPLEQYEDSKQFRRNQKQMMLPRYVRERILMDHGVSRSEMNQAIEESMSVRKQRQQTVDQFYFRQRIRSIFGFLSFFRRKKDS